MAERTPHLFRPLTEHPAAPVPSLSHRELLGRRLVLNTYVRFVVGGLFVVAPWIGAVAGLLNRERALLLAAAGLALLIFNAVLYAFVRGYQDPQVSAEAFEKLRQTMLAAVVTDYLFLALVVTFTGGIRSPVTAFYLLHVVLSCLMLSGRAAIGFTVLAFLLMTMQAVAELGGFAPGSVVPAHGTAHPLEVRVALAVLGVYLSLFALTDALLISLVKWLRLSERELRDKNERLAQLSRLRRDFLHVAVHNLRSPVGASQMLVENLMAGAAGPLTDLQQDRVLRIGNRLQGLQELLQDLRVLGELETEDVDARSESVELEEVLRDVAREYGDQAESVGITLIVEAEPDTPRVRGIRRLVREAVVNYVTNAIKYAQGSGPVFMNVKPVYAEGATWARVEVRDAGPGIAEADLPRLFREFFSAPPRSSNDARRPPGSGLGLSIARRIAEAHGGRAGVDTKLDQGSTFWLELPGE